MLEVKKYLTHINYKKGKNKQNKFIIMHYTANDGDTALGNCKYFDSGYRGASANYFVDETSIYQCVEDCDIAWHIGARKYYNDARNENSIGIEMCSKKDKNGNYYIPEKTVENAKVLVEYLLNKYDLNWTCVLRHYDCSKKRCPEPWVRDEEQWNKFRGFKEGEKDMEVIYNKIEDLPDWAKPSIEKALNIGVLKGTGKGLGLTLTETKMLVWLDRCKCLDFNE